MVWKVVGLAGDHTQSIQVSVKDFIRNSWSLTGDLAPTRIRFGLGWYDKGNQYQIHFRSDTAGVGTPYTVGAGGYQRYDKTLNIHFWVSNLRSNSEPAQLDKMYNEVERIVGSDRTGLESSQGICAMWFIRPPFTLPQPDSEQSIWHGISTLAVRYFKYFA